MEYLKGYNFYKSVSRPNWRLIGQSGPLAISELGAGMEAWRTNTASLFVRLSMLFPAQCENSVQQSIDKDEKPWTVKTSLGKWDRPLRW